jgi:ferredoxin
MNHLEIDTNLCIGCGKCAKMCMKGNIEVVDRKARETGKGCLECSHCVSSCPKGAIKLIPKSNGEGGFFSDIKKSKSFDGGMISEKDLKDLYYAMDHGKGRCEFVTLSGNELNALMETVWHIVKDREKDTPVVKEWAAWRDSNNVLQPNPVLWNGSQVLFIFTDSIDRALIASNRMVVKGLDLGIRGFHSNIIMTAYSLDRSKMSAHFPGTSKELKMAYVIGHARRLIEPAVGPITKLKGLFGNH